MPRVLVADDTRLVRWAVGRALRAEGFEVVTASTRDDALGRLVSERFDLLVLPLALGREEIRDLVSAVARHQSGTAMILLSSSEEAADLADGANTAVIGKPFSVGDVVDAARRFTSPPFAGAGPAAGVDTAVPDHRPR